MVRPVITERIAVDADGELLTWIDGELNGELTRLENVRRAAELGLRVPYTVTGPVVIASLSNPKGAAAALLAAAPGRTRILEAPASVLDLFTVPDEATA